MKKLIKKIIHFVFKDVHFFSGVALTHVDRNLYPYCNVCGIRPKEDWKVRWFVQADVDDFLNEKE